MTFSKKFLEALRLIEILIPITIRGLYQVIVEALHITLSEMSEEENEESDETQTEKLD
jgi:hypothetical protein